MAYAAEKKHLSTPLHRVSLPVLVAGCLIPEGDDLTSVKLLDLFQREVLHKETRHISAIRQQFGLPVHKRKSTSDAAALAQELSPSIA